MIKWTNRIAIFAVVLMLYWTFVLSISAVFELHVFKENVTELFGFSIMGILALLAGTLTLNVMLNLTDIAKSLRKEKIEKRDDGHSRKAFWITVSFLVSFPILVGLLFFGDSLTTSKRRADLKEQATALVDENQSILAPFFKHSLDSGFVQESAGVIKVLSNTDSSFPEVRIIVEDQIKEKQVFLEFGKWIAQSDDEGFQYEKSDLIHACSKEERAFLKSVFESGEDKIKFIADGSRYKLYYPYKTDDGIIVIQLSKWQRYGKIGS